VRVFENRVLRRICGPKSDEVTGKVKLFLNRPWRPLGLREVEAPTFSNILLIDDGKVVSPTRRQLFSLRKIPGTDVDPRAIVRLEELGKLKKSTSSGTQTGDLPACSIVPQSTTLPRKSGQGSIKER
jgi:hypothetical protein